MLEAPVTATLLHMTWPVSIGMLSTFLFQVVDTYFVGQLGPEALAALGFASTAYFLLVGLFIGMAVGTSALVARALGERKPLLAARYTRVALMVALLVASALSALGTVTLQPAFLALDAEPALLPLIEDYLGVLYLGMPLLVFGIVGGSALRASGHVKAPEAVMAVAGVINLVLDYVLIFGHAGFPALGLQGAAVATVVSWVFVFGCMAVLLLRAGLLTMRPPLGATSLTDVVGEIGALSGPAVATQLLVPLTMTFTTFLVARSGTAAVAAFGLAGRIEMLALVGINAAAVAIVPFVAQNHGAGKRDRVDLAVVFAGKLSVYWGLGACALLVALSEPIVGAFTDDPQVIAHATSYFRLLGLSYPALGLITVTASVFNGLQQPTTALRVLAIKTFALTFPMALTGAALFGLPGVFIGSAFSTVLGAVLAGRTVHRVLAQPGTVLSTRSPLQDYAVDGRSARNWLGGLP